MIPLSTADDPKLEALTAIEGDAVLTIAQLPKAH
jgi:hypothetical protein